MPLYQLLTDRTLAEASAITPTTLIHIVTTVDTRQNTAGSSYKAELGQLSNLFNFTGGTYILNSFYSTDNTLMIKVIDSVGCEFFTLISCPEDLCVVLTEIGEYMQTEDGFNLIYC